MQVPSLILMSSKSEKAGRDMTLSEFKNIWWLEYIHRQWGRSLGAVFMVPLLGFMAAGCFGAPMLLRLGVLTALIGGQVTISFRLWNQFQFFVTT